MKKSGLEPEEVRKVNDFSESQAAICLEKYQEYAKLGVTPKQLMQIDKMYADRCREISELEKRIKRKEDLAKTTIVGNCNGCKNDNTDECMHCMRAYSDCYEV